MDHPYLDTVIYDNFNQMLKGRTETNADTPAIRYQGDGGIVSITYKELAGRVAGVYFFLDSLDLKGKHVGILSENRYEYIVIYLAAVFDCVIVPLDRELPPAALKSVIEDLDVDLMFVTYHTESKIRPDGDDYLKDEGVMICNIDSRRDIFEPVPEKKLNEFFGKTQDTDKDRFAVLASTSGTDGKVKGVMLSQYNVITNIRGTLENNVLKSPTLAFLPMHHTYGFNPCILATLYNGTTLCLNLRLPYLTRDIKTFDPYFFGAVPMVIEGIYDKIISEVKNKGKEKQFLRLLRISAFLRRLGIDARHVFFGNILCKNLRLVVSGGAPLKPGYVKKFDDLGITILNGYGLTECSPTIAVSRTCNNVPGSSGTVMKNIDVKIAGDGEILVKGPNVMLGYYKDEEATARIMRDGYLATGDTGRLDGKVIFVTGRKKNLIILENGKNVPPEYLEELIGGVDYVKECLVIPRKVSKRTSVLHAIIVLSYPASEARVAEDIKKINEKLPSYMRIEDWEISENELQKNTSGKILRRAYV